MAHRAVIPSAFLTGFSETPWDQVKYVNNPSFPLHLRYVASCPAVETLGRGGGKSGVGGQEKPSESPQRAGRRLFSELQSLILGLLFSLFVWFPFFPGDPPYPRQSFSVVSRRGPQGPSSRTGVEQ